MFNDAVSGAIWFENQVSNCGGEMIESKLCFEQWLCELAWIEVQHYQSDNCVLTAGEFKEQCKSQNQKQSFSGVGAQHMNARAERLIGITVGMAYTFMIHDPCGLELDRLPS